MSMTLASLPAGQLAPAVGLVAAGGAAGFGLGKARLFGSVFVKI